MKDLATLNKYFVRYKYRFLLGILFVVASNITGVFPPRVIGAAFDIVKEDISYYQLFEGFELQSSYYSIFNIGLLVFGAAVLVLAIVRGLFMFMMRQTIVVMSRLIEYDLRNDIYAHYQKLSSAFYKRNQTGDLMSRISEDVSRVRMYLGPGVLYSINLVGLFVMVIGTMLSINVELTIYVLSPLPILSISIYYVNTIINKRSEAIQRQLSELTSVAQESFSGIRVLKSYAREEDSNSHFEQESEHYKQRSLGLARVQALFFPLMILLVGLSTVLTIYLGGLQVIDGKITSGNIAEFVIYVNMLTWPVTSLGWVASIIQRAAASQKRINEFLETEPEIVSESAAYTGAVKGQLEFNKVSFTYPDTGIEALKDVSFKVMPGEKLAIVGRTGSGKTTIADLLVRMYDVSDGKIEVDKVDVKKWQISALRDQIGYVPQDVFMFSDTVEDNILFGGLDRDTSLIADATKNAVVYDDIMGLPEQFTTMIGERGVTLSGGQKQRISIARALIKKPQILILDDCLSAIDAKTEKEIVHNLNTVLQEQTCIIITHRVYSLMEFDHILVLDEGKVAEYGNHDELIKQEGLYFELYTRQQVEDEKITS